MSYSEILTPCKTQTSLMKSHVVSSQGEFCTRSWKKNTRPRAMGKNKSNITPNQEKLQPGCYVEGSDFTLLMWKTGLFSGAVFHYKTQFIF